jgi:hypothetical protein
MWGRHYIFETEVELLGQVSNVWIFITQEGCSVHTSYENFKKCLHGELSFLRGSRFYFKEQSLKYLIPLREYIQLTTKFGLYCGFVQEHINLFSDIQEETKELSTHSTYKDNISMLITKNPPKNRDSFGYIRRKFR